MLERILDFLIDLLEKWKNRDNAKLFGAVRSPQWSRVRAEHLKKYPACAVCGETKKNIEVHHKFPYHLDPSKELDPNNLITLCESKNNGIVCHRAIGHLGDYKSFNPEVEMDAQKWYTKIKNRE